MAAAAAQGGVGARCPEGALVWAGGHPARRACAYGKAELRALPGRRPHQGRHGVQGRVVQQELRVRVLPRATHTPQAAQPDGLQVRPPPHLPPAPAGGQNGERASASRGWRVGWRSARPAPAGRLLLPALGSILRGARLTKRRFQSFFSRAAPSGMAAAAAAAASSSPKLEAPPCSSPRPVGSDSAAAASMPPADQLPTTASPGRAGADVPTPTGCAAPPECTGEKRQSGSPTIFRACRGLLLPLSLRCVSGCEAPAVPSDCSANASSAGSMCVPRMSGALALPPLGCARGEARALSPAPPDARRPPRELE